MSVAKLGPSFLTFSIGLCYTASSLSVIHSSYVCFFHHLLNISKSFHLIPPPRYRFLPRGYPSILYLGCRNSMSPVRLLVHQFPSTSGTSFFHLRDTNGMLLFSMSIILRFWHARILALMSSICCLCLISIIKVLTSFIPWILRTPI